MDRRKFIKTTAAGIGGSVLMTACVYKVTPYQFFTQNEANCVIALTDQIIPADDFGPGAAYANVVNYIDRQLVQVFIQDQSVYRQGIVSLQKSCKELYAKLFENLDFETQTKFLEKIENDQAPKEYWTDNSSSGFFGMIISHTMQGFYGSPRHGGNKNYISYRLMNLEYPLVVGQNRYRGENGS